MVLVQYNICLDTFYSWIPSFPDHSMRDIAGGRLDESLSLSLETHCDNQLKSERAVLHSEEVSVC